MNDSWILALADDLTGALETGAKFAACGLSVSVTTDSTMERRPREAVMVIDTETRHMAPSEACLVVAMLGMRAARFSPTLVYKKTDSTLRGNIAAELRGLQQAFPQRRVIYAPAYPAMGRTVRNGHLLIGGVPVNKSGFGSDLLNPVLQSNVHELLGDVHAEVLDGETDGDVMAAARIVLGCIPPAIAVGPAALAGALAALSGESAEVPKWPDVRRCLAVNGSAHPASKSQIEFAKLHGCFNQDWRCLEQEIEAEGLERARQTGFAVFEQWQQQAFDAIIVFGGDTAYGIHQAFGSPVFQPHGEIVPGVPVSSAGGLTWITKAGGFGAPDVIREIRRRLT